MKNRSKNSVIKVIALVLAFTFIFGQLISGPMYTAAEENLTETETEIDETTQSDTIYEDEESQADSDDYVPQDGSEEEVYSEEEDYSEEEPAVDVSQHPLAEVEESVDEELLSEEELSYGTRSLLANPGAFREADSGEVEADGVKIEKINIKWLSKSTGEDEPAGKGDLYRETDNDKVGNQQFQIDFAISGKDDHEPGSIEIVFPAYLWLDRYGREPGKLTLSVPEDPETGADFAWKRVGDNIVITNTRKMSAASKVMLQCTFRDVKPYDMVDCDVAESSDYAEADYTGHSREFSATINLTTPLGNTISMDSNSITATIDTHVEAASATKSALNTSTKEYYVYHTLAQAKAAKIPQEFLDSLEGDLSKYSFVRWYVSGSATGSQPFDMTITDTFNPDVIVYKDALHTETEVIQVEGKILGVQSDKDGNNVLSPDGESVTATLFSGYDTYPKSAYVWTVYDHTDPRLEEGVEYEISNTQTTSVTGWDDKITTTKEATATAPFHIPVKYSIKKVWNDNNNAAGNRPSGQNFTIYYTDEAGTHYQYYPVNIKEANDWSFTWSDDGQKREYHTYENALPGEYYGFEYDEDNRILSYDRWWYEQEKSEYDPTNHTWTYTNKYRTQHYENKISKLVPRRDSSINKYTQGYTNSSRMSTSDRALNELRRGDDVVIPFSVSGYSEFMALTYGGSGDTGDPANYGRKEVTVELEDNYGTNNNSLIFDDNIKLTIKDAEVAYVTLNNPVYHQYYMREKLDQNFGTWSYRDVPDLSAAPEEEVLLGYHITDEESGAGEWVEYATLNRNGTVTTSNGAKANGRTVYLPTGVWKVKSQIVVPSSNGDISKRIDRAYMSYNIGILLKGDSETLAERLVRVFEQNDYGLCDLDNFARIQTIDSQGGTSQKGTYSRAYLHGRNYRVAVHSEKSFELVDSDSLKRELQLHSTIKMTQQSNVLERSEYDAAVREGLIPNSEEGIWYDLLPLSVLPDLDSIKLSDGDTKIEAHVINNYKQTGRVMLVVKAALKDRVSYTSSTSPNPYPDDITYPKEGYKNEHTLEFDSYYSWDQARLYGLDNCRNVAAFETTSEDELGNIAGWSGEPDDPQKNHNQRAMDAVGNDKDVMTDIDPERTGDHKAFTYAGDVLHYEEIDFMAATELRKYVTKDGLGVWTSGRTGRQQVEVYEGGYYSYMLYVASDSETVTTNIILVDSLENYVPRSNDDDDYARYQNGYWKGEFVSVDTSTLEEAGIAPVVWYYTGSNDHLDISGQSLGFGEEISLPDGKKGWEPDKDAVINYLNSTEGWSTTLPEDTSTVKAIAIDARHKADGTDFALNQDQNLYATIRMKAPIYETTGESTDPFDPDPVKRQDGINNDHAYNNVYLGCTQTDAVGRDTNAYFYYNYTRVGILPFELKVTKGWDDRNNNDGVRPEEIIVHLLANGEDTGKTLTLNEGNEWTGVFSHILQYDEDGNWISYTFREESTNEEYPIDNYKAIISREDNDVTIRNTHVPETTKLSFSKEWEGETDEDIEEYRPDQIVVRLFADGVFTGKSVIVKPDRMGNWSGSFSGLPKYTNPSGVSGEAHEIIYTVEEEPVYKYVASYEDNSSDGNKSIAITNTFYPFGDLKVRKTVTDVTENSKDQLFTFNLILKDNDGNDLTEKYPYFILEEGERIEKVINEDMSVSYYKLAEGEDVSEDSTPSTPDGTLGNGNTFALKGGQVLDLLDIPSESKYEVAEVPVDGFRLVSSDGLGGSIRAGAEAKASFTNKYSAEGAQNVSLKKTLTGRTMSRYQFSFELEDITEDSPKKGQVLTASADLDGIAKFGTLRYTEADHGKTYIYEIREIDKAKPGYTYDTKKYTVEVSVTDNGDGTMTCTPVYKDADGNELTKIPDDVLFENEYHAEGSIVMRAWKQLPGVELAKDQFTFELLGMDEDGVWTKLQEKKNDENGLILWDSLEFDETDVGKTYLYVAREVEGDDPSVRYDDSLKGYELSIADNGDGTLAITQTNVKVKDDGQDGYVKVEKTDELPVFVNKLEPGNLDITKITTWDDQEPDGDLQFNFTVTLIGDELPEKITVQLSEGADGQQEYSAGNKPTALTEDEKKETEVELDENGSFTFTLKAGQKLTVKDLPAGTLYQITEAVPSGWTLEAENSVGEVPSVDTAHAVMNNKYEPGKATATLFGSKLLDGKAAQAGRFAFELTNTTEGSDSQGQKKIIVNEAGGFIQKSEVYTQPGTYTYTLKEVQGLVESVNADKTINWVTDEDELRKIKFDDSVYDITVVVKQTEVDGNINLNVESVKYTKDGKDVQAMQFLNTTVPGSLQIEKVGNGLTEANKDAEFTFKVKLTNEAGMPLDDTGSAMYFTKTSENPATPEPTPAYDPSSKAAGNGGRSLLSAGTIPSIESNEVKLFSQMLKGAPSRAPMNLGATGSIDPQPVNFGYTGAPQTFTAPYSGYYKLEAWGAQGGNAVTYSGISGGKGGYTSGNIYLNAGQVIYVYVGGAGQSTPGGKATGTSNPQRKATPGWNGGGGAGNLQWPESNSGRSYGSGGGATDFRLTGGAWNNFSSLKSRIMVAGAGGGAADNTGRYNGGAAGGLVGINGTGYWYMHGSPGIGGGQNYPGYAGTFPSNNPSGPIQGAKQRVAGFGRGNGENDFWASAGGGSGYYGGGGSMHSQSAAGGSSFISGYPGCDAISEESTSGNIIHTGQPNHYSGMVFSDPVMKAGNASMPKPTGGNETGHSGNGYARITPLFFTIHFDKNDDNATGTMESIQVSSTDGLTLPPCTYQNELVFAGWTTDSNGVVPEYGDCDAFTDAAFGQEITLYAIWMSEDAFLLHFDANGGYTEKQWQIVNGPEDTVELPTASMPGGYEFLNWTTEPDGSGDVFADVAEGADFKAQPGDKITLYAQYLDPSQKASLTVQHYLEKADGSGEYDGPVAVERTAYDIDAEATAEPHSYIGFKTGEPDTSLPVTMNSNKIVKFYYDRTRYTLAFDANGGEGEMADIAMLGGVSKKLPVNQFSKENSIFIGWNTEKNGSGTNYGDGQTINSIGDDGKTVTLYAQWYSIDDTQTSEPSNGEYTVTCKAGETIIFPSLPAGTTYEITEVDLPDGWELVGDIENAKGTILSAERINIKATNKYSATGSADLTAHKTLQGETMSAGQFSFQLIDDNADSEKYGEVLETAVNSAVDEAEQIAGEDEEAVDNPWYGTAPVRFSSLSFDHQGVYQYKIREVKGNDSSINYDEHEENVTILVTDRGDGRLNTQVFYDDDDAHFINEMSGGNLKVSKTLSNASQASMDMDFVFVLRLYDSHGNELKETYPVTMSDGSEKTIVSGGSITMKGGESFTVTGLPHQSKYIVVEVPTDGFELVKEENNEGTILAGETAEAAFENAYNSRTDTEGGTGAQIEAKKVFELGEIQPEQFEFRLTDSSGEEIETVYAATDGTIQFTTLHYTLEDDGKRFIYYIEEVPGEDANILYDDHKERVDVTVKDNGNGTMTAVVEYAGETEEERQTPPEFTNEYQKGSLQIVKTLDLHEQVDFGNRIDPASFIFRVDITAPNDEVIYSDVVTLVFTEGGTQTYEIGDLPAGSVAHVEEIYAGGNYTISGDSVREVTIVKDDKSTEEAEVTKAEFTNTYNDTYKGGGSVTNTITDADKAEQSYAQETGGDKE